MVDEVDFEIKNANSQMGEPTPRLYEEDSIIRPIPFMFSEAEEPIFPRIPSFHRVASFERDIRAMSPSLQCACFTQRFSNQNLIAQVQPQLPKEPVFMVYEVQGTSSWCSQEYSEQKSVGLLSMEERKARIERYLRKKKRRNFANKSYPCRRLAAISRPRIHGRFISYESYASMSCSDCDGASRPKKFFQIRKVR